jgi:hypothetical protein
MPDEDVVARLARIETNMATKADLDALRVALGHKPLRPHATLYCSFCAKSQHEVKQLIVGPGMFICDECVRMCMKIVEGEQL